MPKKIKVEYPIEKGIHIPVKTVLPLSALEVGDSVAFPIAKRASIASQASVMKRRTGKIFTISKMNDEVCRIWRTS